MMTYQIKIPSNIYCGEGSITKVKEIIIKEQARQALIFTDKGIVATGLVKLLEEVLEEAGVKYQIYDELQAEPSYQDIEKVIAEASEYPGEILIAIGGGSVMDAAKLYSVLKNADYNVRDLLENPAAAVKNIKSIMIPTTCGTGSEATCNAIVAIPEQQSKQGIVNEAMIPDYVILDGQMIRKLPRQIIAATGVDALAHVVECYTSKKATPLSDTYAMAGAKLIFHNIRKAYCDPDDMDAKNNMLLGAFYGGIAITGSGTTAVHALAYPLGGKYHIAHGISNAILLAHVMAYNKSACSEQLAELCDGIYPELAAGSQDQKAQHIIDEIAAIVKDTEIPTELGQFGVDSDDLDFLVKAGSQQTRLLVNNRRELNLEDICWIYQQVVK